MTLSKIIAEIDAPRKRLVFSGPSPPRARQDIRDFLDIDATEVTQTDELPESSDGPSVSVYADGGDQPLLTTDVETLWTAVVSDAESLSTDTIEGDCPRRVLEPLGTTVVSGHSTQQMIVASRHVERRAHEVEAGQIHTCFQQLSLLGRDLRTVIQYNLLAGEGVDVHIYGFDDHDLPNVEKPTVHRGQSDELAASWVVAFDGTVDGDEDATAALVAQERAPEEYAGFWTFDPEITGEVIDYMTTTHQ